MTVERKSSMASTKLASTETDGTEKTTANLPARRMALAATVLQCQPIISRLRSDRSSSGAKLLPRAPDTAEMGHRELGFDGQLM